MDVAITDTIDDRKRKSVDMIVQRFGTKCLMSRNLVSRRTWVKIYQTLTWTLYFLACSSVYSTATITLSRTLTWSPSLSVSSSTRHAASPPWTPISPTTYSETGGLITRYRGPFVIHDNAFLPQFRVLFQYYPNKIRMPNACFTNGWLLITDVNYYDLCFYSVTSIEIFSHSSTCYGPEYWEYVSK